MLSLISNEVRIGSSVRLITLPTIMIYRNTWVSDKGIAYVLNGFALNFAHVVVGGRCLLNHLHRHRGKNAVLSALAPTLHIVVLLVVCHSAEVACTAHILRHEESAVVARCKL